DRAALPDRLGFCTNSLRGNSTGSREFLRNRCKFAAPFGCGAYCGESNMFGISYLSGKTVAAAFRHPARPPAPGRRRPTLEELERREVPAPLIAGPAVLAPQAVALGQLPGQAGQIATTGTTIGTSGTAFNTVQGLLPTAPGGTASSGPLGTRGAVPGTGFS